MKRGWACVCVCVRSLHSKLPLKLEEEFNSQMNTLASFCSQWPLFILKGEFFSFSPHSHSSKSFYTSFVCMTSLCCGIFKWILIQNSSRVQIAYLSILWIILMPQNHLFKFKLPFGTLSKFLLYGCREAIFASTTIFWFWSRTSD